MASKIAQSKETVEIATRDVVEKLSMSLTIYEDTNLVKDREIKMKWQDINDMFSSTFEENPEDYRLYVNVHKSSLYRISYMYPTFPYVDVIH